ncbi:hypothetical protein GIB67_022844 [Kingdonia uniflora]|uniref:Uncharacterized protein n=1 Tax=Kingdonia uniflora TaxID=39325 RepID=A0A7J7P761_9MAGN|nr:hypothetical protein GIB67_022844 [Kingdonia uniflora]
MFLYLRRDLTSEAFQMLENSKIIKDGFRMSVGIEIDIDGFKINHHAVLSENKVPRTVDFVCAVGEDALEIEFSIKVP